MSAEIGQIKFEQSEEDEDNNNNLNLESNKYMNTKRKSISQNSQAKNDLPSKTSKTKSKDHLKLQIKQQQQLQSTLITTNNPPEINIFSGNILHSGGGAFLQGNGVNIATTNYC